MNGYLCPCCESLITLAGVLRQRDCPTCKASIETQDIAYACKTSRANQEQPQ